jgi:acetylornithine deacetylase/succinyl-diaminopimelate desuccinylase-like protein
MCDEGYARILRSVMRDTMSPDVLHAGVRHNVIPGEATIEVDCRTLPGTSEGGVREELVARLGDLAPRCTIDHLLSAPPVEAPAEGDVYELLAATVRDHDPDGVPVPMIVPFASDAKHLMRLGVPAYGFSPLRLDPEDRFLQLFHATDERIGLDALRWGLPVLYDVVVRFCG